jgi:Protein of unknown function (DUF2934)
MPSEQQEAIRRRAYEIWEQDGRPDDKAADHWRQAEFEYRYFHALRIDASTKPQMLKSALARANKNRDFEIEHYWKRATYFWAFQVAIFAAFGFLWRASESSLSEWGPIIVGLAGLGILTAIASALSARGSRFWQNNWEKHIEVLEDFTEGRLYKTVWLTQGKVSFSVSRINQYLSYYFSVFWIGVAIYVAWKILEQRCISLAGVACVVLTGMFVLAGIVLLFGQTTDLRGTVLKGDGSYANVERDGFRFRGRRLQWFKGIRGVDAESHTFIRRKGPDEP